MRYFRDPKAPAVFGKRLFEVHPCPGRYAKLMAVGVIVVVWGAGLAFADFGEILLFRDGFLAAAFFWAGLLAVAYLGVANAELNSYRILVFEDGVCVARFFGLVRCCLHVDEIDRANLHTHFPGGWIQRDPPLLELRSAGRTVVRLQTDATNASRFTDFLRDAGLLSS